MPGGQTEVGVHALDGLPCGVVVRERLAHAHEDHVRQTPPGVAGSPGRVHHLFDDLAGGELSIETGLTGGAERAPHRTTGLAGDADRGALVVVHEHGLDAGSVVERPQPLHGGALVAGRLADDVQGQGQAGLEVGPQRLGDVRELGGRGQVLIETAPHLVDPIARLVLQERAERGAVDAVAGERHRGGTASA